MASGGPDIGALLAGLGAGGGVGAGPGGPPPGPAGPGPGGPGGGPDDTHPSDLLGHALDLLMEAYGKEQDPIFKEKMGKAMSVLDQIFSEEQKQKDQAMGGQNLQLLRRG